jgi:hypothetical protein
MIAAKHFRHVCTLGFLAMMCFAVQCRREAPATIQNSAGVRLAIADENTQPALRVTVPGPPPAERTFEVLFPEHVTGRVQDRAAAEHLYVFRPGKSGEQPRGGSAGIRWNTKEISAVSIFLPAPLWRMMA